MGADVDCTEGGKALCEQVGVKGFPTIKWGDPNALEDYEGGRDYDALKAWAKENLKPVCSPTNIDLCDEEKKGEIKKFQDMPAADLEAQINAKKEELKQIETKFEEDVKALQEKYKQTQEEKDAAIKAIKASGLGIMQAVHSASQK